MFIDDTICAPATGTAGSAIAVIRLSGADTFAILSKVVEFRSPLSGGGRVKYGVIKDLDEVLVSVFKAPHSYTGEDSAEISCHCSPFIVSRILELLTDNGARMAGPGEFTRRAYVNGKMDLAQAEAVADLIASESRVQHKLALDQLRGAYSLELRGLRDELVELGSLLELELDFSEEDVEFASREKLARLLDDTLSQVESLVSSFKMGNAIRQGVPVAIVGEPNSGKSTLLNALLGEQRAIVSDIPGTTRDTVEETLNIGGVKFRFIDTAGLRDSDETIEKIGIERSYAAIGKAKVILLVIDGENINVNGYDALKDVSFLEKYKYVNDIKALISPDQRLIPVFNKVDLSPAPAGVLGISALTGEGLEKLKDYICKSVDFDTDHLLVSNERHCHALRVAAASLRAVREGLDRGVETDLLCLDLRSAVDSLNSIFGDRITPDEVLGNIFQRFCIGK